MGAGAHAWASEFLPSFATTNHLTGAANLPLAKRFYFAGMTRSDNRGDEAGGVQDIGEGKE
jgi:hypothetical protein